MRLLLSIVMLLTFSPPFLKAQEVELKYSLDADGDLRNVAFSPDGKLLATISGTKTDVWLWDSTTGRPVSKLSSGKDPANYVGESNFGLIMPRPGFMGLRFSPDASVLAVLAQVTKDLRLWDIKASRLYATLSGVRTVPRVTKAKRRAIHCGEVYRSGGGPQVLGSEILAATK